MAANAKKSKMPNTKQLISIHPSSSALAQKQQSEQSSSNSSGGGVVPRTPSQGANKEGSRTDVRATSAASSQREGVAERNVFPFRPK